MKIHPLILALTLLLAAVPGWSASADLPQSAVKPGAHASQKYPKIVLYSVSWCPHCKEAKEYFTSNNIPFINKDVELDTAAYEELTKKYKSPGVPVIVLGDDAKVIKGFDKQRFEKAVQEVQTKK